MKVLVLGVGLQGRAAVQDLDRSAGVDEVLAADLDVAAVTRALQGLGCRRTRAIPLDATQPGAVAGALRAHGAGALVFLAPPALQAAAAREAIEAGAHFVSTNFPRDLAALDGAARERGVALLPEAGLDPGIDLVMAHAAVASLSEVSSLSLYGSGIPEPAAAGNPLRYKVSWSLEGVLGAYRRPARLRRDGREVTVPADRLFAEENVHLVEVPGLGPLEAYPNGDALPFAATLGLGAALRDLGRYSMRWPGHCAAWRLLGDLGLLDDAPIEVQGHPVVPRAFLAGLLGPRLQYAPDERDLAILRVEVVGRRDGTPRRVVYDLVDRRDPVTGLYAMNRTVGYTASIAAQLLLTGEITARGLLSTARDVPPGRLFAALRQRGMEIGHRDEPC